MHACLVLSDTSFTHLPGSCIVDGSRPPGLPLGEGLSSIPHGQRVWGGISCTPCLRRRAIPTADGGSSVGSSFLQCPSPLGSGDGPAGSAHPFPPCPKVPPAMPCGPWGTKSPPPSWLRQSRSPRCHGVGAVSASMWPYTPSPCPFLYSLPLLLSQNKLQGWGSLVRLATGWLWTFGTPQQLSGCWFG